MIPAATSASTAASSSGSVSWPPQRARNASQAPAKHFFFSHISCPNFSKNLSRHSQLEISIMMSMINIFYLPNNFMRSIFDWLNHLSGSLSPRLPRLLLSSYIRYAASRITCLISNNSVWWKRIPLSRIVKAAGLFWTCIQKSGSFSVERDHFPKSCQKPKPQLRPDTKHFHGKLRILFSFLMIYDII